MRSFLRNEKGTAIIEFGILAPIFFYLVLVLIDLCYFDVTHSIVDDAVENSSRAVRLGSLSLNDNGAGFRTALCSNLVLLDCNNFTFSVSVPTDLTKVNTAPTVDATGKMTNTNYCPGGPGQIAVIQIVYIHTFLTPYAGNIFGDSAMVNPFKRALISYLVVNNEPFPTNNSACN